MDTPFETGFWTLYFHPSREKRWTIDSFEKIGTVKTARDVLSIYKELDDKIKSGEIQNPEKKIFALDSKKYFPGF